MHKPKERNADPHVAMKIYRATPLGPTQPSLIEILHVCKVYSDIPMANAALCTNGMCVKLLHLQNASRMLSKINLSKVNMSCLKHGERFSD